MLRRIAEVALRRPRALLVMSLIAVVAMGAVGFGAFGKLQAGGFEDPDAPSSRARTLIADKFGGEDNLVLLVRAENGRLDSASVREAGVKLTKELKENQHLSHVTSYWDAGGSALTSRDGSGALVLAHVRGDSSDVADRTKEITDEWSGDQGPVDVRAGGGAALNNDISEQVSADLAVAESVAVPLTLVLLVIAFGSFVAALLPLAIGLIAILGTFAELFVLGSVTDVSVFSVNLTTALGLGLGIDYGLLIVSRFRERLSEGDDVGDALRTTVTTAGRTIAFSAATVVAVRAEGGLRLEVRLEIADHREIGAPLFEVAVIEELAVRRESGVAVGQPGGPLLVGAEEVAVAVERQADGEADAGAHDLAALEVRAGEQLELSGQGIAAADKCSLLLR